MREPDVGEHKTNGFATLNATRPRCGSCPHFVKEDGGTTAHCRERPPTVFVMQTRNAVGQTQMITQSFYPPTTAEHWCGRHSEFMRWWMLHREQPGAETAAEDADASVAR